MYIENIIFFPEKRSSNQYQMIQGNVKHNYLREFLVYIVFINNRRLYRQMVTI